MQTLESSINDTCYRTLHKNHIAYVTGDIRQFLSKNQACVCTIVDAKFGGNQSQKVF